MATGAAGGATAVDANSQLERCDRSLGTLTIVEESKQPWIGQLSAQYRTASTVPLLRMTIQQSNCFVIVERGQAMRQMQGERELTHSGELRKTSNFGKGQMVARCWSGTDTAARDCCSRADAMRPKHAQTGANPLPEGWHALCKYRRRGRHETPRTFRNQPLKGNIMNVHKHMEAIFVVALATVSLGSFALDDLPEVNATTPVIRAVAAAPAPAGQALVMCASKAQPRRA